MKGLSNVLNQKEALILEYLIQNSVDYSTSQDIAPYLGVSDKTARKYLSQLDEKIDDKVAQIKSVSGHGYQLVVQNEKAFMEFRQINKSKNPIPKSIKQLDEPKDRQNFILHHLFFENELLYADKLVEHLYISKSTLMNDMAEINKKLKPFDLVLKISNKTGVSVSGDEQNKRHFIMNYFLVNRYQDSFKAYEEVSSVLTDVYLEEILLIVLDEYRNAHLKLNETIIFNIVIHIALALKRVESGHPIQINTDISDIIGNTEIQTAKKIIQRLEKSTNISLPEAEVYNIALHLKNKQTNEHLLVSQNINEAELYQQIVSGLKQLEKETGYPYFEDTTLIEGLMTHFIPFLFRINGGSQIKNPLLAEIKENYQSLFRETKSSFENIKTLENKQVSDDEWAYVALHVIAAHERQLNKKKTRTLVICATGLGSSQMIKMRLENELGSKLLIDDVISYYEITDEKLKGIELVVSSIDLSNFVFNVPVVNVSVLLKDNDIKEIKKILSLNCGIGREKEVHTPDKLIRPQDIIDQYFDPQLFILSHEIKNRKEAISTLVNQSNAVDSSIDKKFLTEQLKLREKFSSVVFAKDVAVPHPIEGASNEAKVAILITPHGIEWDEYSNQIRLTFLMIPDRFGNHQMEKVSQIILPIIENQEFINTLVNTTNYKDFIDKFIHILSERKE